MKIITLLTDFGVADGYIAAMKGVILSLAQDVTLVDVTHEIEPQNVRHPAVVINTFAPHFPPETIHIAVVDPGVGTDRALLAVRAIGQIFLAPDNGLLSLIFERDPQAAVRRIANRSLFTPEVSRTFHGRDILAPVAAHLALGVPLAEVGPEIDDFQRGLIPHPEVSAGVVRGQIIYCDHFGNLITNISRDHLTGSDQAAVKVRVGSVQLTGVQDAYSDVDRGEPLCLIGSSGYLEIAVREGSAARKLKMSVNKVVEIRF